MLRKRSGNKSKGDIYFYFLVSQIFFGHDANPLKYALGPSLDLKTVLHILKSYTLDTQITYVEITSASMWVGGWLGGGNGVLSDNTVDSVLVASSTVNRNKPPIYYCSLTGVSFAQIINRRVLFYFADFMIPFPQVDCLQSLPRQRAAQQVHEHVAKSFQVVTTTLFWNNSETDYFTDGRFSPLKIILRPCRSV